MYYIYILFLPMFNWSIKSWKSLVKTTRNDCLSQRWKVSPKQLYSASWLKQQFVSRYGGPHFPPINWRPRYNWNIVESGVKHHKTNQSTHHVDIKCKFVSPVVKIPNLQFNVLIIIDPKSSYHFVPVITNENTALKFHSFNGCSEGLVDMVNSKSLKMPKG